MVVVVDGCGERGGRAGAGRVLIGLEVQHWTPPSRAYFPDGGIDSGRILNTSGCIENMWIYGVRLVRSLNVIVGLPTSCDSFCDLFVGTDLSITLMASPSIRTAVEIVVRCEVELLFILLIFRACCATSAS